MRSKNYWENRYKQKKTSGAGSYGRVAEFKANIINEFVLKNNIHTVIEFGCGDGNQLTLSNYQDYIGFDVSNHAIQICKNKFKNDATKRFYNLKKYTDEKFNAELVLSLEVIFHLIEDKIFEDYMKSLFMTASKYVVIFSSNYDESVAPHVKCRQFTNWIDENVSDEWILKEKILNIYPYDYMNEENTSFSDFYIYKKKS